jgi:hypothetical protein
MTEPMSGDAIIEFDGRPVRLNTGLTAQGLNTLVVLP